MTATPDILSQVTSPLALAALVLLVGSALIRAVVRQKDRPGLRATLRWVFLTAIILGALANVAYVLSSRFNSEIRIAGKVRDSAGNPLARVVVDLVGTGSRGISDDSGDFNFTLPASRQSPDYQVQASLPGYLTTEQSHPGPKPPARLNLVLNQPALDPLKIIDSDGPNQVLHQLGLPFVDLSLTISNPLPWDVDYKRLQLALYRPGQTTPIKFDGFGSFAPLTYQFSPIFLSDGRVSSKSDYRAVQRYSFISQHPDALMMQAVQDAQKNYGQTGTVSLSAELAAKLAQFAEHNWFWEEGTWTLEVSLLFDGRPIKRAFQFVLTPDQIARMRQVTGHYETGMGVLPDRSIAPEAVVKIVLLPKAI